MSKVYRCISKGAGVDRNYEAKPAKCRSLAFRRFNKGEKRKGIFKKLETAQYSSFDPVLKIAEAKIKFIGRDDPPMFKYLGRLVQFNLEEYLVKKHFEAKLVKILDTVDAAPLEGRMKAWIVNHHVCSKVAWTLMVQNSPTQTPRSGSS